VIWSPRRREGEPPLGWWRAAGVTALLACLYFIAPFGQETDPLPLAWAGALALLVVAGLALLIVRRIKALVEDPTIVDLPTLAVLLVCTVIAFAAVYYSLEQSSPGEVAGLDTRLDSLYMTLVTVTTVGYGDVHPAGQTARALACLQLAFNAVFIGALVRTVGASLRSREELRPRAKKAAQTEAQ